MVAGRRTATVRWAKQSGGANIALVEQGYGSATHIAVDPFDDSAWITTDAPLLLHFSTSGALLGGTSLHAAADALYLALDQTPWLLVRGEALHLSRSGEELERRSAPDRTERRADRLRGRFFARPALDRRHTRTLAN